MDHLNGDIGVLNAGGAIVTLRLSGLPQGAYTVWMQGIYMQQNPANPNQIQVQTVNSPIPPAVNIN